MHGPSIGPMEDIVDLGSLAWAELRNHLLTRSGLPGRRANLTLLDACAGQVDLAISRRLSEDTEEYLAMCGAAGVARSVAGVEVGSAGLVALQGRLTTLARSDLWRVREAVPRGLQLAADVLDARAAGELVSLTAASSTVAATLHGWLASPDLRLLRAALATICEPRLLRAPEPAALALEACARVTDLVDRAGPSVRRSDPWRAARTTLDYAWSVAVAADPAAGLPVFSRLTQSPSATVRSIADHNLRRARLSRLVVDGGAS